MSFSDMTYLEIVLACTARPTTLDPHHPSDRPVTSPVCHLRLTGHRWEVPTTASLGSINLLQWLTKFRETFYLQTYQFIIKGHNSGRARDEICVGQGTGKGVWIEFPCPTPERHSPSTSNVHQPRSSQNPSFRVFVEASLHGHDLMI